MNYEACIVNEFERVCTIFQIEKYIFSSAVLVIGQGQHTQFFFPSNARKERVQLEKAEFHF